MSRTRVKFNALKDTELSTADTETSAKGVITFCHNFVNRLTMVFMIM